MKKVCGILLLFFILLNVDGVDAQDTTLIKIINADRVGVLKALGPDVQRLIGNVVMKHDSTWMYCDSAYLNDNENYVDAFGNVHIKDSDTLNLYGRFLHYDGINKIAEIHDDVRLVDNKTTLSSDHLYYDRLNEVAKYYTGAVIENEENTLVSRRGFYFTQSRVFFFKDSVVLSNPDYVMHSDTLKYYTESKVAVFLGPTIIDSEDNSIYCENGWYNTDTEVSQYNKNAVFYSAEQSMRGDSLYYDRNNELGKAYGNITIEDTVKDIIIKGNIARYDKSASYSMVTDSALAIIYDDTDSLFLHADTLRAVFDSAEKLDRLYAFYKAKFYRKDFQGMCDSMIYFFKDSLISLNKQPVLWSDENQLSADTIRIEIRDKAVHRMYMINSCFIISMDDTSRYNQIKGMDMTAYFDDNSLSRVDVNANAETVYYIRDEDSALIGINKAAAARMKILMEEGQVSKVYYYSQPAGGTHPEGKLPPEEFVLKGFSWIIQRRPLKPMDVFFW